MEEELAVEALAQRRLIKSIWGPVGVSFGRAACPRRLMQSPAGTAAGPGDETERMARAAERGRGRWQRVLRRDGVPGGRWAASGSWAFRLTMSGGCVENPGVEEC